MRLLFWNMMQNHIKIRIGGDSNNSKLKLMVMSIPFNIKTIDDDLPNVTLKKRNDSKIRNYILKVETLLPYDVNRSNAFNGKDWEYNPNDNGKFLYGKFGLSRGKVSYKIEII
jgi:hypothetical protein